MMTNTMISHIKKDAFGNWQIQSNEEHSNGVAAFAESFASEFSMADFGKVLGLLHDKGKEKIDFQNYIKRESGFNVNAPTWKDKSHAYVGGIIAAKGYATMSLLLANPIMGHHAGLYDYMGLDEQLHKNLPSEIDTNIPQVELSNSISKLNNKNLCPQDFHHVVRMLYSCLVDADFLDTEKFMDEDSFKMRGNKAKLDELLPKLEEYLSEIERNAAPSEVNYIRKQVQQACIANAESEQGFYSLTVPTGGGKTLSSLVWAMRHAVHHKLNRIIVAIPYTSIVVQTASILKSIFGEENVLEHHSNFDYDDIKNFKLRQQIKLATENWDYPIIVTTNVQLFESMFSNKPSSCRKLHNICKSVIILDEVQTLPTDFLKPIVDTLKTYQKVFDVSVLFTTASQPILSGLIEGCNPKTKFDGIADIHEIIPSNLKLHENLRRTRLDIDDDAKSYDEIAEKLSLHDRVLCIVNTRTDAKEIFERLPKEGITIHLSRMMCPAHIRKFISKLKEALKDADNKIIRVVATQLIEAGVDIDFPVVYRQEAGLDSILQAAGRCNREGKLGVCTTHVFSLKDGKFFGNINTANDARKNLLDVSDYFAPEAMTDYFKQFYCRCDTFDKNEMVHYLYKLTELMFETASKKFRLIDENTIPVIVNWEDSLNLVEQLKKAGPSYSIMKQLSKYSVNVRHGDLKKLAESGAVIEELEDIYVVRDSAQYDENIGLKTDNHWLEETYIV